MADKTPKSIEYYLTQPKDLFIKETQEEGGIANLSSNPLKAAAFDRRPDASEIRAALESPIENIVTDEATLHGEKSVAYEPKTCEYTGKSRADTETRELEDP